MSDKSKKLLENLRNITAEPEKKLLPTTNRFYIIPGVSNLPKIYDNAKRKKDEDGEEFVWIDRVYGSLFDDTLIDRNGFTYKGKVHKKRRLVENTILGNRSSFYSRCYTTADGRWFDNTGFPIEAPNNIEPEKKPDPEELELERQRKIENAKAKEAAILANLK